MALKRIDINTILGYAVSAVMTVSGLIVVSGLLVSPHVPGKFRYMFGAVLILMGVYRFLTTRVHMEQRRQAEEDEE